MINPLEMAIFSSALPGWRLSRCTSGTASGSQASRSQRQPSMFSLKSARNNRKLGLAVKSVILATCCASMIFHVSGGELGGIPKSSQF